MKNGFVPVLLTGATYLRGKADNSQLQRNDMLLCSTALLFIAVPKNPDIFMEVPQKSRKHLNHGPDSFKHQFSLCVTEILNLGSVE